MITVIIPTSPSIVNPDTSIIDKTIESARKYLPDSPIIVTLDGFKSEASYERQNNYRDYYSRLIEKYKGQSVKFLNFGVHLHQSGMMFEVLKHVITDQLFYLEHDWELVGDIPFFNMSEMIRTGVADLVRILYPTELPPYYMDKMIDQSPQYVCGIPVVKTFQWSQNPHLASTKFYKEILNKYFKPSDKKFIEEGIIAVVEQSYKNNGWNEFKTFIYVPEGNTQRCIHLDGRQGEVL